MRVSGRVKVPLQSPRLIDQVLPRGALHQADLRFPVGRETRRSVFGAAHVLLQDDMGIHASEPEGIDAGSPRSILPSMDPGACLCADIERGLFQLKCRVRGLTVQGGGQHLVVQGERRLDQAGDPCRRHEVTNHRLDSADSACGHTPLAQAKHLGEGLNLGQVANRCARPVGFDQLDRFGRDTSRLIGAP